MGKQEWQMTNAKWQMTNAKWQMTNAKWQMTNAKWQMTNAKWQMTNAEERSACRRRDCRTESPAPVRAGFTDFAAPGVGSKTNG
ncbi:MAG: hypothetical protein ABSH35_08075 [Isosphaeraceae bacterium]